MWSKSAQKLFTKLKHKRFYCLRLTEQHYVSIFFTVGKPLLFDTKNPEIS